MWIIARPCRLGDGLPLKITESHVKNLILPLGIASALLIAACGKQEAAVPAAEAAPAPVAAPATTEAAPTAAPAATEAAPAEQTKTTEQPKQ